MPMLGAKINDRLAAVRIVPTRLHVIVVCLGVERVLDQELQPKTTISKLAV